MPSLKEAHLALRAEHNGLNHWPAVIVEQVHNSPKPGADASKRLLESAHLALRAGDDSRRLIDTLNSLREHTWRCVREMTAGA